MGGFNFFETASVSLSALAARCARMTPNKISVALPLFFHGRALLVSSRCPESGARFSREGERGSGSLSRRPAMLRGLPAQPVPLTCPLSTQRREMRTRSNLTQESVDRISLPSPARAPRIVEERNEGDD